MEKYKLPASSCSEPQLLLQTTALRSSASLLLQLVLEAFLYYYSYRSQCIYRIHFLNGNFV